MKQENIILDKSFAFAVRVVKLYQHLCNEKKEYVLSKQLLRSGTSIGANINEAQAGQSKNDFIAKMSISSKEARETKYWIDLLIATSYLNKDDKHTETLVSEIEEIIKMLISIVKSSQENK
ncbi:MAG: four helix bundle protein [Sulfuricurvum sp.]|nr:four helix bundle protein [Sulfuricurvum sp.]